VGPRPQPAKVPVFRREVTKRQNVSILRPGAFEPVGYAEVDSSRPALPSPVGAQFRSLANGRDPLYGTRDDGLSALNWIQFGRARIPVRPVIVHRRHGKTAGERLDDGFRSGAQGLLRPAKGPSTTEEREPQKG